MHESPLALGQCGLLELALTGCGKLNADNALEEMG